MQILILVQRLKVLSKERQANLQGSIIETSFISKEKNRSAKGGLNESKLKE